MIDDDRKQSEPSERSGCGFAFAVVLFIGFSLVCVVVSYLAFEIAQSSLPKHDSDVFSKMAVGCWLAWLVSLVLIGRSRQKH